MECPRRPRCARSRCRCEDGFTLIEMIVGLTLMAMGMLALAQMMFSGLNTLRLSRERSAMIEIANAEMEKLRALDFGSLGVDDTVADGDPVDPNFLTQYPGGKHDNRPYVPATAGDTPLAIRTVTVAPVEDADAPYQVLTWVTWHVPDGATDGEAVKRLDVEVVWGSNGTERRVVLTSVRFPGTPPENIDPADNPPVADFTVSNATNPGAGLAVGDTARFDGSASTDENPSLLSYSWTFDGGSPQTGQIVQHTFTSPGDHTVVLTVAEPNNGRTDTIAKDVSVGGPPVASFSLSQTVVDVGEQFNATNSSTDPNGDPMTSRWDYGDGTVVTVVGTGPPPAHSYGTVGNKVVTLTVSTPDGLSSSATATVSVGCVVRTGVLSTANPVPNDTVEVNSATYKPTKRDIRLTVVTTGFCTSISGSLPGTSPLVTFGVANWNNPPAVNRLKTWVGTLQFPNAQASRPTFPNAAAASAVVTATGTSGSFPFTWPYAVVPR